MYKEEKLLIITKTYPLPSSSYREHACMAAINGKGELRRLFPIPFRFLSDEKRFRKWQWISARIENISDERPESYRIDIDSVRILADKIFSWQERLSLLQKHSYGSFDLLEKAKQNDRKSIGIIKPHQFNLEIKLEKQKEWTKSEINTLTKECFFDPQYGKKQSLFRKLPYKFYYRYSCIENEKIVHYRHLIIDWEVGMQFLNCQRLYGERWEEKLREKLEIEFRSKKELFYLMGTVQRSPERWLIIGLIYPPKNIPKQDSLFSALSGV